MSQQALVIQHFEQNIQTSMYAQDMLVAQIEQVGQLCTQVLLSNSNRLFTCGMQLSELVGQYLSAALLKREAGMKPALPSINLNINSFMQMGSNAQSQSDALRAFAQEKDLLIAFALDGDDLTINETVKVAKELGMNVVLILGQQGYRVSEVLGESDVEIRIPADEDSSVIEHQILVSNTFIKLIDSELFGF